MVTTELTTRPAGPVGDVRRWRALLAQVEAAGPTSSDAERVDLLEELERLKSAAAAAQARVTVAFAASRRAVAARGDAETVTRSVAAQVGLARHDSAVRGRRHLGLAQALVGEMPHTMAALTRGDISEWRATIVVRETACLTREDRATVDHELAGRLADHGDRRLGDAARGIAQRLDPGAAVRRARKATSERRVSLRPAPDTMSYLTGLLPVADGVAVHTSLRRQAEFLRGQGDPRTLGQLMADLLVGHITGRDATGGIDDTGVTAAPGAAAPERRGPDVEIHLVMSERTLLHGSHEPAEIPGFGPGPAAVARRLVRSAHRAWLRRLFTAPGSGDLVAMDSHRRRFSGKLRDLLVLRDQTCRTPWCDAPIRHADHVTAYADGGETVADNGQGLCEACNYVKQAPGWRADVIRLPGMSEHVVETTTPTGHTYRSAAPPLPGAPPTSLVIRLRNVLDDTG